MYYKKVGFLYKNRPKKKAKKEKTKQKVDHNYTPFPCKVRDSFRTAK